METTIIVLGVLLIASLAAVAYLTRALVQSNARFFEFADDYTNRWALSHKDLADKVLSHSDKFLELRRIEVEDDATPPPRRTVVQEAEARTPLPEFDPDQGTFVNAG